MKFRLAWWKIIKPETIWKLTRWALLPRCLWWTYRIPFFDWLYHRACYFRNPGCNMCWRVRVGILRWGRE